MACIPMRNIGAIIAGLATPDPADRDSDNKLEALNTEGGELQSTRWPPLPTIAQTIDQMQGGCDGYARTQPNLAMCNSLPTHLHRQLSFCSLRRAFAFADS